MLFNAFGAWVGFNAFDLLADLLTQPLLVIAGDAAGLLWHSKGFYAKAPGAKELFLLEAKGTWTSTMCNQPSTFVMRASCKTPCDQRPRR